MSQIDTSNINANFPVQGQDNPSQGFRDNFSYIKIGLDLAAEEITQLENIALGGTGTIIVTSTSTFLLNTATNNTLGGVKIGSGITITADGTISAAGTLTPATGSNLGGVKIGAGIQVTGDGTISVTTASFALQTATNTIVGGVKIGAGISISNSGTISVSTSAALTTASSTVLGGVKIGAGVTISADGTISVTTASFALQTATNTIVGGVKIGSGISITEDGTISASTATQYSLPIAAPSQLGGVKIGTGIAVAGDGTISVTTGSFALQTASAYTLGGIKIGTGLEIGLDGTASVSAATQFARGGVIIGNGISVAGDGTISVSTASGSTATSTTLGVVKIGDGISISADGTISVFTGGASSFNQNLNTTDSPTFAGITLNGVAGRVYGDFTSSPEAARLIFQTTTANGLTRVYAIPRGSATEAGWGSINKSNPSLPSSFVSTYVNSAEAILETGTLNGGSSLPLTFKVAGNSAMRIAANNTVAMYGLTDSTSKTTGALTLAGGLGVAGNVYATMYYGDGSQLSNVAQGLPAGTGRLGPVIIGAGVNVDINGVISVTTGAFALQTATNVILGGVKIGSGINVSGDGTISANITTASTTVSGIVKIGTGIGIAADGTISVTTASFALQTATNVILGGVKIGSGINVTTSGTISVSAETMVGSTLSNTVRNIGPLNSLTITNQLTVGPTAEVYTPYSLLASTSIFNCSTSSVFVVTQSTGTYGINFTNVTTVSNRVIGAAVIITQGNVAQIPTPIQVNGVTQTVKWSGGTQPNGNAGKVDVLNFSFITQPATTGTTTSTFTVLANLSSFG